MRHYIFQRKNLIPFLLLMASCGLAVAQSVTASNMLDAANSGTDLAGRVLAEAFGETFYKTPGLPGSGSGTTLGTMFGTFNAALLAVGVFWFSYNVTAATVQTAEGGEFMGQRFSTIWFPIRFIVGISTLVPMFGGYCGAQVIMMYFAKMSIGMANLVVAAALSSLGGFNTASAVIHQNAQETAKAMFNSNLCMLAVANDNSMASSNSVDINGNIGGPETNVSLFNSADMLNYSYSRQAPVTSGGDGACGSVKITLTEMTSNANIIDVSSIVVDAKAAHKSALASMNTSMQQLAQDYLNSTISGNGTIDFQAKFDAAAKTYEQIVTNALSTKASSLSNAAMSRITAEITNKGWMALGSFYQSLAVIGDTITAVSGGKTGITAPQDPDKFAYSDTYKAALKNLANVQHFNKDAAVAGEDGIISKLFHSPGQTITNMVTRWSITGKGVVNPIIEFKDLGDGLIWMGSAAVGGYTAAHITVGAADGAKSSVIGMAADFVGAGALRGIAKGALEAFSPFAIMAIVGLFSFGITLAVYIPMLPFIIWFGGIMAWFANVLEGLIAAPVGAFAHLEAEGDGMGQRSQHAYLFLFGVLLRPSLMVFGFFGASYAVKVLGSILLVLFAPAMANAQFNSTTGFVMFVGFLFVFVSLVLTLIHGCFNLIHIIPDQVISWVGGHVSGTMGKDTDDRAKGHFAAGVVQIRGGMQPGRVPKGTRPSGVKPTGGGTGEPVSP
jgi:conjugal transfer/type IV secretion protein DotA/TraY